jgi:ABC-2 type transport system permease protein
MEKKYSQFTATMAIVKASFRAIFSNPSAIIFSILFPIIFIMIFGAFGNGGASSYKVALEKNSDTTNAFYQSLRMNPVIRFATYKDTVKLNDDLIRGQLTAILGIQESRDSAGQSHYLVTVRSTSASNNTLGAFLQTLDYSKMKFEAIVNGRKSEVVQLAKPVVKEVRKYRSIDFILPGQLGFSILFSTLFGIAFTFFGLREQLVLKRFYATPVKKVNILLGIGVSRLFFQVLNVVVLIGFGYFFLNFTLQNGFITFLELLFMTIVMLFLLMGVGLIFSSIVKSDTSIPLLINLFGFPQMLLSGTFFPTTVFPAWLQKIIHFLPLTQFNDAIRKISFEGLHITDCWEQLLILGGWMVLIYIILVRVLKWE